MAKKDHFNTQTTLNEMDETKMTLDKKNSLFTNTTSFVDGLEVKNRSPQNGKGLFEENSI